MKSKDEYEDCSFSLWGLFPHKDPDAFLEDSPLFMNQKLFWFLDKIGLLYEIITKGLVFVKENMRSIVEKISSLLLGVRDFLSHLDKGMKDTDEFVHDVHAAWFFLTLWGDTIGRSLLSSFT